MRSCRLKINYDKTEFIVFAPRLQQHECMSREIDVVNQNVERVNKIKYLEVILDTHLTLRDHVSSKCIQATSNIVRIRSVRKYLTEDVTKPLMTGLVLTHLNYSNARLTGMRKTDLIKFHRVQNFAARV